MSSGSMGSRFASAVFVVACVAALGGCKDQRTINRIGPNVVSKALFEGSWYFGRTVIDVDYEGAGLSTFPGDSAIDFEGSDLASMPRIRWVIDERRLLAFRDYELLEGGNPTAGSEDFLGEPVAAFDIESHFDIRRDYDPSTGEERNVLVENTTDRPWYEREYMRVDWSKNLLPGYYGQSADLSEVGGFYERQPADLYVQDESAFPESWRPRFDYMGCDGAADDDDECDDHDRLFVDDYALDQLYHMSFVTQDVLSPAEVEDPLTGENVNWCVSSFTDAPICTSVAVYVRNAFLRVSDRRQYEPLQFGDHRFERHGYFRLERPTIDRRDDAGDPGHGETDFLNYAVHRHNLWMRWRNDDGTPIPYADRQVRRIVFHTTRELPAHLVEPSFDSIALWNETFMGLVRDLRGQDAARYPRIDCQNGDPDGYCYCQNDPVTGTPVNPTCAGRYDPFETPAQATARGVENPYDCWVELPPGARPDLADPGLGDVDFEGWFGATTRGSECAVELRVNTCHRAAMRSPTPPDPLACEERGDLRFRFVSYVDQPGTSFLGVATLRGDPVTGEIRVGDANVGGPALDAFRTTALQTYDLVNGVIDDREFLTGEDVRSYLTSLELVQRPAPPRIDFSVADALGSAPATDRETLTSQMDAFLARARQLEGPEGRTGTFVDRRTALRGTGSERRLMENLETLMMAGIDRIPDGYGPADIGDPVLDLVSPFRRSVNDLLRDQRDLETRLSRANILLPNEYVDNAVMEFAERHAGSSRPRLEIAVNRLLYFQTLLHELGHCFGLRHDFGGSADLGNYGDDYYVIKARVPDPVPAAFDLDGTPGLSPIEQVAFEESLARARRRRELAGIDRWMSSSIMEYGGQWYSDDVTEIGRYDRAAIRFGYGELVELYDNQASRPSAQVNPVNTERAWTAYYEGGEACTTDAECPFATAGARASELRAANLASGVTQRCVPHPNGETTHGRICSAFDDDARALASTGPTPPWLPVEYRFCSDERVGTLGFCHRWDEGDSYREIVRNLSEQYDRQYVFTNFRRYRSSFSIGAYIRNRLISRQFGTLQNIFQDLLFRYANDDAFSATTGAFGFGDQFLATADILNFYARILAQPDLGFYTWDEGAGRYREAFFSSDLIDLEVPFGMGRYFSSVYQRGLSGITRVERIGSFYDKWTVMRMLAERGWTTEFTRDVPFWTSYYDLFPVEMQEIFQGLIQNRPESLSPRVLCASGPPAPICDEPRLVYMDLYRGDCTNAATCRESAEERYSSLPVVDGGSVVTLQLFATVLALSEIPVFFDTSFQSQLFLCVEGQGDCQTPAPGTVEGVDFVRHASSRFGKTFLAWQVEPTISVPNQTSIGFAMVKEAKDAELVSGVLERLLAGTPPTAGELTALAAIPYVLPDVSTPSGRFLAEDELARLDFRLQDLESFFFQIVQLQNDLGIFSFIDDDLISGGVP